MRSLTGFIADLDSPFYAEERQREVWNEASAVGFQTMLWGGLGLSCAMVWVGGRPLVGWAIALLVLVAVAAHLMLAHAKSQGVEGTEGVSLKRPRVFVAGLVYLATIAGVVVRTGADSATVIGIACGALVVGVTVFVTSRRAASSRSRSA